MATADATLQVVFSSSIAPLLAAAALYFAFATPRTRTTALLAVVLGAVAARGLASTLPRITPLAPDVEVALENSSVFANLLAWYAFAALAWGYPAPLSLRSWHGRAFAAAWALHGAGTLLFYVARDAYSATVLGEGAWAFALVDLHRGRGLSWLLLLLLLSVAIRAWSLPERERRVALTLVPAMILTPVVAAGSVLVTLATLALQGELATLADRGLVGALDVALGFALPVGIAVACAWRRSWATLLLVGYGVVVVLLGTWGILDVSLFPFSQTLRAIVPLYLVSQLGAFGLPRPRGLASRILPIAVFLTVFLMANIVVLDVLGDSALGLVAGMGLGLAGGVVAALLATPATTSLHTIVLRPSRADSERRLQAYRAALERELASGKDVGEAANALVDLRISLGVTLPQHDALAAAIRAVPLPPPDSDLLLGRYRVLKSLGGGSQGVAKLCRDTRLDRDVVVKSVPGGGHGSALAEARALARVRHPNVVSVFDVEERLGDGYVVMEFVDGGSLRSRLARSALPAATAARVVDDVLAGLEAIHAAGLVHRDVKPENVLLTRDGVAKIADFGLARDNAPAPTLIAGGAVGTLHYMAPEQVLGRRADARSDLYAVGVLLHEAVTGRSHLPRPKADDFDVRAQVLTGARALALPPAAARWAPVIERALDPDPARRFPDAAAMRRALADPRPADL